ncbi:MAG: G8 domain-containing protein [Chitinophagaceae bacterium]|nr:G8 domain-containing protein [Chitinophagaceae bacterium]
MPRKHGGWGAGTKVVGDGNNWNPNGVPTAAQTVTIGNTYTVILNTSTTVASLTIGGGTSGSLTIGNNNTDRTLTVTGILLLMQCYFKYSGKWWERHKYRR